MAIADQVCRRTSPKNRLLVLPALTPRNGRYLMRHGSHNCHRKQCCAARYARMPTTIPGQIAP